jgi:uncharacterized protein (DUF2147 family)
MFTTLKRIALLPIVLAASAGTTAAGASPIGIWIDHTGRGAVEITDCNGALCGHVVWLKSAGDEEACNMQVLGNVKPVAGGKWDKGWIYDPERRAKFDVEITPLGDGKLKILGYAGVKLFSETMTWTRAPADLKRCGKASVEAKAKESAPAVASAEAPATEAAASAPAREAAPSPAAPEKDAGGEVAETKGRQARSKAIQCTISIGELGKFSFPC